MTTPEPIDPVDDARTTRAHAGEAITDGRNWPGYILIALSLGFFGGGLVAAADGFGGWTAILFPVAAVLFLAGLTAVLLVRKRVKNAHGLSLTDTVGH